MDYLWLTIAVVVCLFGMGLLWLTFLNIVFDLFVAGAITNAYFFRNAGKISIAMAGGDVEAVIPMFIKQTMPGWSLCCSCSRCCRRP